MTSRRDFLQSSAGAIAGVAFVGCDLMAARLARAQSTRRQGKVGGKPIRVIDVHAHCAVPEAMALMGLSLNTPGKNLPAALNVTAADDRIAAMDAQGIDMEALSINPYWYKADRDLAAHVCEIQNARL